MYSPRRIVTRHVASCLWFRSRSHSPSCILTACSNFNVRRSYQLSISSTPLHSSATHANVCVSRSRSWKTPPAWLLESGTRRSQSSVEAQLKSDEIRSSTCQFEDQVEEGPTVLSSGTRTEKNDSVEIQAPENETDQQWILARERYNQKETVGSLGDACRHQSALFDILVENGTTYPDAHARGTLGYPAARLKADLSYHAIRKRETAALTDGSEITHPTIPTVFRHGDGIRRILWQYMRYLEPLLKNITKEGVENKSFNYWLSTVFSEEALRLLHRSGYGVEDIASWSWIVGAKTVGLSIRRYTTISMELRNARQNPMPLFIPLQLLRAEYIDSRSLTLFIQELEMALKDGCQWGKESGAILTIRLLRHARFNNAGFYEGIAELALRILSFKTQDVESDEVQRLTHFYNRFLSLIALPLPSQTFSSVPAQQRAQLKIARFMTESRPQILLNREGYRALARLQLMHEKTREEQRWSSVKAPSWPPWRQDELGIDARAEYPGQQSRVAKVIKRLLEAGYGPESMEREVQILAGWDIDKSPTIQVRKVSPRQPLLWIKSMFNEKSIRQSDVDHHVWAARVAATRSIREAWVCFYSYMEATMNQRRQLIVYHEMFHKLFARAQQTNQRLIPSPGDGKEVYPDPPSPRDLVYVPKEPPTIAELYGQMIQDGIPPAGRLLANLIDSGHTLKTSLDYVRDSTLSEVKKDVLLRPEKYPRYFIRNVFSTLPDYLLASFIGSLTKHHKSSDVELFWPAAKSVEERGLWPSTRVKPLYYGMALMQVWKPRYMPAYHAILEGICIQAMARRSSNAGLNLRQYSYSELWITTKQLLDLLKEREIAPDLVCFRKLVILARNHTIRASDQFTGKDLSIQEMVSMIKSVFADAIHGNVQGNMLALPDKNKGIQVQPYWKDIEALIVNFGFASDFEAIVDLLKWLQECRHLLDCVDEGGSYKMQRIMCAARVALEALWAGQGFEGASKVQMKQAQEHAERWGWPEKADVDEFLDQHAVWFEGMRAAIKRS